MLKVIYSLLIIITIGVVVVKTAKLEEQSLTSYQRCLLDVHCQNISENSFCFGNDDNKAGVCKCIEGYELLSRNRTFFACLQYAGWDEPCEKDIQCYYILSNNAVCDTTCKCAEGTHRYVDGKCYPSIRLGDFCQTDANCLLKDETFGNCIAGRCDCKYDKQLPTQDGLSCVESRDLGEICENDDQCSFIENTVCRVSCRCAAGFALSRDEKRCLKAATSFYDPCDENAQCSEFLQGSLCNNGNCTCQDGFHGFGSRCARNAGIGGSCTGLEECIPDPKFSEIANCIDGVCQCLPGAIDQNIGCGSNRVFYSIIVLSVCNLYLLFNYL